MRRDLCVVLVLLGLCTAMNANAVEGPKRKPGLWETTRQTPAGQFVSQICVDAASEAKTHAATEELMKANCSKYELHQEGGKWISDSTCTFSGQQVVTHAVITPIGDSAFHTEGTLMADAKWLGPCKPGQTPGVPISVHGPKNN